MEDQTPAEEFEGQVTNATPGDEEPPFDPYFGELATPNTRFIAFQTMEYPIFLNDLARRHPNTSFAQYPSINNMIPYGYMRVWPTPAPPSTPTDLTIEIGPVQVEGEWYQTWSSRPYTEEELATNLLEAQAIAHDQLNYVRDLDFDRGMEWTLNGNTFHVQLREGDRINLLILHMKATGLLSDDTTELLKFRNFENETVLLTAAEMIVMTKAALSHGELIYTTSWALKDRIRDAVLITDIPVLIDTVFITPAVPE